MTKEEREKAIDLLDNLVGIQGNDYDFALKKGIEALKQEDVLDKIRAEICEYGSMMVFYTITKDTKTDKGIEKLVSDVLQQARDEVLEIIDKYKAESEGKE